MTSQPTIDEHKRQWLRAKQVDAHQLPLLVGNLGLIRCLLNDKMRIPRNRPTSTSMRPDN
jgi:hypothetical protein